MTAELIRHQCYALQAVRCSAQHVSRLRINRVSRIGIAAKPQALRPWTQFLGHTVYGRSFDEETVRPDPAYHCTRYNHEPQRRRAANHPVPLNYARSALRYSAAVA